MSTYQTAFVSEGQHGPSQDRVRIFHENHRLVIVVADGAGGVAGGEEAAERVVAEVHTRLVSARTAQDWVRVLTRTDQRIPVGESTGVVVDLTPAGICGAGVGDSEAWIIQDDRIQRLTSGGDLDEILLEWFREELMDALSAD